MTDILDLYARALDGFDAVVAAVADWDGPSACTEWSRRDVLGHVVWGQRKVEHHATGREYADVSGAPGAPEPGRLVATDPVGRWRAAREASVATLNPGTLALPVTLRAFGEVPLAGFVTALVTDTLAHAWDIGSAAGLDVRLDPELAAFSLEWSRQRDIRQPGGLGPEVPVPADADVQTRLLGYLGRRPLVQAR